LMYDPAGEDVHRLQSAEQMLGRQDQFTLRRERQYRHAFAEVYSDPLLLGAITELDYVLRYWRPTGIDVFRIDYTHELLLTSLLRREQEVNKNERSLRMSLDRG
jgi:hypothetical protein